MSITNNRLRWLIDINVFMTPITHTNFNANVVDLGNIYNGMRASSGAQNAEIGWDIGLGAGTWTFELMHNTANDQGIFTVSLDGVSIGTIDSYSFSNVKNVLGSITSVAVAASGKKRILIKMATKNASSSNYSGRIQHVQFRRTA